MRTFAKLLMVLFCVFVAGGCSDCPEHQQWKIYKGEMNVYHVEIYDNKWWAYDFWTHTVRLDRIQEEYGESTDGMVVVIGYTSAGDDRFEQISIRESSGGCVYSFFFMEGDKPLFQPCFAGGRSKSESFTVAQIAVVQSLLYQAMATVHNTEHLVYSSDRFQAK